MGRAAAAPDGATAAVKEQQVDVVPAAGVHQRFLRAVLRPRRRQGAGVLGRIGVADHHFLRAGQARPVAVELQQAVDAGAGVVQVVEGFEQRHHAHRPLQSAFLEQQLHGQHIGRMAGHGDHVGAQ
ncbi:hypothetical protein D9M71_198210 [compost metagenome]